MGDPEEDDAPTPGGHAARRLEEFLKGRLPPGGSPDELNPELAEKKRDNSQTRKEDKSGPQTGEPPPSKDE